jgi:hypothetical protein
MSVQMAQVQAGWVWANEKYKSDILLLDVLLGQSGVIQRNGRYVVSGQKTALYV